MAILTVSIPVYNEERFLARTLDSVLRQSFTNFILLISDNHSTDRSYSIACQYAANDDRIVVHRQPVNVGMFENGQYCLDQADTQYFMWLGGHDLLHRDYFQQAVAVLEKHPSIIMVCPNSVRIDQEDQVIATIHEDIDTVGLSPAERLYKIARTLNWCPGVYGVFRTDVLRMLQLEPVIGTDHLLVFMAAFHGDIHQIQLQGIRLRQNRIETSQQAQKRYQEVGIYRDIEGLSPYALLTLKHLEYLWRYPGFSWREKFVISWTIKYIFAKRFKVRWREIFRHKFTHVNNIYKFLRNIKLQGVTLSNYKEK